MKGQFYDIYSGRKVLVTGDTGFKGSWLVTWLKELGAEVYGYALPAKKAIDNFVVSDLGSKINHYDGDIRDKDRLFEVFDMVKPEIVFHLAAQPLVLDSYRDPHYTFETNLIGTVNLLEAVRNTGSVKVAINVTSDKCYKNNEWLWGYREADQMGGEDPYSASKGCSELITQSYMASFFSAADTPNIATARAGNVIGGQDWADNRIIPDYFRALHSSIPLLIRYPNAIRPWQHVLEPLSGYLLLGVKLWMDGKKYQGAWNFGPGRNGNQRVIDLIEQLKTYTGPCEVILNSEQLLHEATLLQLDISKANSLLGWQPVMDFVTMAKLTVDGYLLRRNFHQSMLDQIREYSKIGIENNLSYLEFEEEIEP